MLEPTIPPPMMTTSAVCMEIVASGPGMTEHCSHGYRQRGEAVLVCPAEQLRYQARMKSRRAMLLDSGDGCPSWSVVWAVTADP